MKTSIKLLIGISLVLFINIIANAQNVGIGTTTPDSSAMLDITSTNTGILIPRMTAAQRNNISNPATGLLIYQTNYNKGFWYYNGISWTPVMVFERNGTTIRQKEYYDTDDFIIGRDTLPENGIIVNDKLMFFDKSKAAFRTGQLINSKYWSPDSIGLASFAFNLNTKAIGNYSTAWGQGTTASGTRSTAFGYQTKATNNQSTAWGNLSEASGPKSTAWGESTKASGENSTAFGYLTQASSYQSTAWGRSTQATSNMSTAWGKNTLASGSRSTAWGESTIAPSGHETALGEFNTEYTPNDSAGWNANDRLFIIGNGTSDTARNNALTLYKNGDLILNRDQLPQNDVTVTDTLLFFDKSKAAFRAGKINSKSWATDSIGFASFAFNTNSKAIGDYSTAWGQGTTASGTKSTAWGNNSQATGTFSTAWGDNSLASSIRSTAWGKLSKATSYQSTAWGNLSEASGDNSTAWGESTIAPSSHETALGAFNTEYTPNDSTGWNANDRLFVIGNGTSGTARNNALTLYKNGDFILNSDSLPQNDVIVTDNLLFFDKSKAAFRAGEIASKAWATDSIGLGSFAFNRNTKAIGNYSTAWGMGTTASNKRSTSWGESTTASGIDATAFGYQSQASGVVSTAWGWKTTASRPLTTAWGEDTEALGKYSTAWGKNTIAPSGHETALGRYNKNYTPADSAGWNDNDRLFVIGNGSSGARHNALTILKKGTIGISNVINPTYALQLPNQDVLAKGHGCAFAWDTWSDSRVKFLQKPINYGLVELMKLVPKSYVHHSSTFEDGVLSISDEGKHTIGLIAQEVYKIIPEAVQKPEDESKELWSMDYEKLIPVLIKGMQQQQDTIDNQKEKINKQEEKINKQQEDINKQQNDIETLIDQLNTLTHRVEELEKEK